VRDIQHSRRTGRRVGRAILQSLPRSRFDRRTGRRLRVGAGRQRGPNCSLL